MAVNGSCKRGEGLSGNIRTKKEIFQPCHQWALGLSREDVGRGREKQQVCLEGRVCPPMYFKLLKSEALVLLLSGEEGFEAFYLLATDFWGRGGGRKHSFSRSVFFLN